MIVIAHGLESTIHGAYGMTLVILVLCTVCNCQLLYWTIVIDNLCMHNVNVCMNNIWHLVCTVANFISCIHYCNLHFFLHALLSFIILNSSLLLIMIACSIAMDNFCMQIEIENFYMHYYCCLLLYLLCMQYNNLQIS